MGLQHLRRLEADAEDQSPSTVAQIEGSLRALGWWQDYVTWGASRVPGLFRAWRTGLIELNNTPGTKFLGDKELGLYVDEMIGFYLRERPLLSSIPGESLANFSHLGRAGFVKALMADYRRSVFKFAAGNGGEDVLIGMSQSPTFLSAFLGHLYDRNWAGDWIRQDYVPSSRLRNDVMNLRLYAQSRAGSIQVSESAYGRGQSIRSLENRVNISLGAHVHAVVVRGRRPACGGFFAESRELGAFGSD